MKMKTQSNSSVVTVNGVTYFMEPKLIRVWDSLKGNKLVEKDEDRIYIVDGRERSGKSLFAIQQAAYIDPTFAKNIAGRICFTPEDFLKAIRSCPKGSVIIFDEAFRGLSSRSAVSKVNKLIIQALMEAGQRNLILFIVLPSFFMLDIYAAMHRSTCLFHVYKSKQGRRGYFRVYNYKKKAQLYQIGLKKGMSYRKPFSKFAGRFYGKYPIDEEQYRKMKYDALIQSEMNPKAGYNNKWEVRSKKMIALLKKELNLSFKDLGELFKRHDIDLERSQLTNIYNEMATVPQKPTNSTTTIYSK